MRNARTIVEDLRSVRAWQEDLYRELHEHPELSMHETATTAEISRRLCEFGYEVQQVGGGVVGVLRNGDGPTVLFRADIDALPVQEATGLPYASTATARDDAGETVPLMHACGHDMHITAALGAACLLAAHQDAWSGTYLALFQPGEEIAAGARAMVADGLVDKVPKPDVALAQHVLTAPWAGQVGIAPGPVLSTGACLRVTIYGVGSHGSMPHLGVDPVVLAAGIVTRLQTIVSREIAPSEFGVVTVGSLQAGTKANIIPDKAVLLLNIRAYDMGVREKLLDGIRRIIAAECEAARSPRPADIEMYDVYPLTDNDEAVTERVRQALIETLGAERVAHLDPVPASEDFSIIPDAFGIPYCYWGFGGFTEGSQVFPNHNPAFAPVLQPSLDTGTSAAVAAVLAYLGKEE